MSLNKVTLIGNLGKDPIIRVAGNGNKIASFALATTEKWTDKTTSEKKEKTEWHNIVVYSQPLISSVIERYLKKGMRIYIEGSLQTRKWVDTSNIERYTTEIVLQGFGGQLIMLNNKDSHGSFSASYNANIPDVPKNQKPASEPVIENPRDVLKSSLEDDIPF